MSSTNRAKGGEKEKRRGSLRAAFSDFATLTPDQSSVAAAAVAVCFEQEHSHAPEVEFLLIV